MAACLIAMSALYVLDWHNRNYGYHHLYPLNATPPTKLGGSTEGVGHMIYQIGTGSSLVHMCHFAYI